MPRGTTVKVEDVADDNFTEFDPILALSTSVLAKEFCLDEKESFSLQSISLKVNLL